MGLTSTQHFQESLHRINDPTSIEEVQQGLIAKDANHLFIKDILDNIEKGLQNLMKIRKIYLMRSNKK